MRRIWAFLPAICLALTACGELPENRTEPLMGLAWFEDYDAVKSACSAFSLIGERETGENETHQKMLDYANTSLYDNTCDLTLCFTDSGLIGLNYHDISRSQNFREWISALEANYGLPTEESSGMASWYDNPLGKDTAIYLFNLEEGVQVSFYATSDAPDRSYENPRPVPAPELRTPIVPFTNERPSESGTGAAETETPAPAESIPAETHTAPLRENRQTTAAGTETTGASAETSQASALTKSEDAPLAVKPSESTEPTKTTEPKETAAPEHAENAFLQNGLKFYDTPENGRRSMSESTQLYEYRTEEPGQPWELIMEYQKVPYLGKDCNAVLCFTSLGLVGVNYFDANTGDYQFWVQALTKLYGSPDEKQYDYTAWSSSPVGSGTMIYVFALEDGVQISFYADDTGSELS